MDDRKRLELEYARRARDPRYREWYAPTNPANRFIEADRDAAVRALLAKYFPLAPEMRVLDLGCGGGHELAKLSSQVAETRLCGIDLLPERVARGHAAHPQLALLQGDAAQLPFASASLDLVMQFTVFTSILDAQLRKQIGAEMLRVLKPRGAILWYDYWFNPTNPQTRGIGEREIQVLFPECNMALRRVTLAPPLTRWLAPRSRALCQFLNRMTFLRTHYLVIMTRR